MKVKILVLFMVLFTITSYTQERIFIDVKTKIVEKAKLSHIKAATSIFLLRSDWATVLDVGPDYAFWIRNYSKSKDGDEFTVNLDLEVREPKLLKEGNLLASKHLEISFSSKQDDGTVKKYFELFKQKFGNKSNELINEMIYVGYSISKEAKKLIDKVRQPDENPTNSPF